MKSAASGRGIHGRDPSHQLGVDAILRGATSAESGPGPLGGFVFSNCFFAFGNRVHYSWITTEKSLPRSSLSDLPFFRKAFHPLSDRCLSRMMFMRGALLAVGTYLLKHSLSPTEDDEQTNDKTTPIVRSPGCTARSA